MTTISTHVLDTSLGLPGRAMRVSDDDGRARNLVGAGKTLDEGIYRLRFDTAAYFARDGREGFFPDVSITFRVGAAGQHYHVPLLLSPFGYTTYRGS